MPSSTKRSSKERKGVRAPLEPIDGNSTVVAPQTAEETDAAPSTPARPRRQAAAAASTKWVLIDPPGAPTTPLAPKLDGKKDVAANLCEHDDGGNNADTESLLLESLYTGAPEEEEDEYLGLSDDEEGDVHLSLSDEEEKDDDEDLSAGHVEPDVAGNKRKHQSDNTSPRKKARFTPNLPMDEFIVALNKKFSIKDGDLEVQNFRANLS
ncbi:uncharacterized protein F4822DRAFT_443254 [Hypoxylon trugodes]|uniref:uncharacterized protein n=1 Tax=Hypoxylon trugodes TaxID=326681 RepID=UPI0021A087B6|nr:uncharacterized protein F4822DRAFT_443254 [Hypoxylon trugodes]KAI1390399.1 hypothetical protein F4822DRAFT_443254 [Hypoxylon trugodes]